MKVLSWFVRSVVGGLSHFTREPQVGFRIFFFRNGSSLNTENVMTLERTVFTDLSTIGELRADGELLAYTLEDTCRKQKIPGKTAIPAGKYEVVITYSERFRKPLPLLLDVPDYCGIRIHPGNTPLDTEGCILPGMRTGVDCVYDSRKAFDIVLAELEKRLTKGKLYLSVIGGRPA